LAQIDLIHVDLENLILAQCRFDLVGQQDFINLAGQCFFLGQEHIAGHLHGDGAGTLAGMAANHVGCQCAHDADIVDAAMLIKAIVLDCQYGVFHVRRNVVEFDQIAFFFTEFTQQDMVFRVNAQWNLGAVVSDHIQRRQAWIDEDQRIGNDQRANDGESEDREGKELGNIRIEKAALTRRSVRRSSVARCQAHGHCE